MQRTLAANLIWFSFASILIQLKILFGKLVLWENKLREVSTKEPVLLRVEKVLLKKNYVPKIVARRQVNSILCK